MLRRFVFYIQEELEDTQLDSFIQDLLERFNERFLWSVMQAVCDHLGLPRPASVRQGCIEIIFNTMTPKHAQALLTVYHDGLLKDTLNKVSSMYFLYFLFRISSQAFTLDANIGRDFVHFWTLGIILERRGGRVVCEPKEYSMVYLVFM